MKIREHLSGAATARGPGDVLAAVPHLIGFHPHSSLVVISVDLEERRTGLIMRCDLPARRHEEEFASMLARRLDWRPPDAVILACYGDATLGAPADATLGDSLPGADLMEHVLDHLANGPVEVLDALYVEGGRWWSYRCDCPDCCPPGGVPLPGPGTGAAAEVAAHMALRGRRTLASRRELEDAVRGPSGARAAALAEVFARVARELWAETQAEGRGAVCDRTTALARELLARSAGAGLDISDDDAARLSLGAGDILVRDRLAAFETSDPAGWLALLTMMARRTPDAWAAPICTIVAWVAYQQGDGALANIALDRVGAIDPDHTLAGILRDCLDGQIEPSRITAATRAAVNGVAELGLNEPPVPAPDQAPAVGH